MSIPSIEARKLILSLVVVDCGQTLKVIVDTEKLEDGHGFPDQVLADYSGAIPIDLNPRFPLDLELSDDGISVTLAFRGVVPRCHIPWRAIGAVAIGIGGVAWEFEEPEPEPEPAPVPEGGAKVLAFTPRTPR